MISLAYLGVLLVSLGCMLLLDHRWRLLLWADARRGAVVLLLAMAFFLAWDVVVLELGMYRRGESPAMTGVELAPELPLEELFFILFLCYLTLVLHGLLRLGLDRGLSRAGRSR